MEKSEEIKKLSDLYYENFYNLNRLIKESKNQGIELTNKKIKEWYESQLSNQIYKQKPKKEIIYHPITMYKVGGLQIDLLDIHQFARENNGFKWIFNIVDIFSRYVWSFPLKDKKPRSVEPNLKMVFDEIREYYPKQKIYLESDDGNEYKGIVDILCKKYEVTRFIKDPNNKRMTSIVERYHQTLLNKFKKLFIARKSKKWIDKLTFFTNQHNKQLNNAVNRKPISIFKNKEFPLEFIDLDKPKIKIPDSIKVGDYVRLINKSKQFEKKTLSEKTSRVLYTINKIIGGDKYELMNDDKKNILAKKYQKIDFIKVSKPNENIEPLKKTKNIKIILSRQNIKQGHEVQEITDKGDVIFKTRLIPKNKKRNI